jgi:hypothetical protein
MADQNLSVDIKIKADTSGAKEAEKAIDGVTDAIQEQTAAEKDLVTQENRSIETMGRYVDAKGRIHEANGKFAKVAAEEREGIKERIKLQEQETGVVGRATVTGNGAAQTKREMAKAAKELEKETTRNAMGFMALSNGLQDVQYGLGGIVNNIPQIITGMGMGMGVAGAVQIAAVGIQFLLKNVDLFGEKAKQAANDASELASETMANADAAYKAAEATKAQVEAQQALNDAMEATEGHYKAVIALSEQVIKQKQAEKDAETALADAQAGMEMARIALAESRGEMTKEDAILAKEKVRTEADARKQTAAVALEEGKVAEARRKATAEDAQANAKRIAAQELQKKGAGMLTDEEKKTAEANKESLKASMEQSRIAQEKAAAGLTGNELAASGMLGAGALAANNAMVEKDRAMNEYRLKKEREAYAEMQAAMDRENAKLAADKAARDATGAASPKALKDAVAGQMQEANEGAGRASALRVEAMAGETSIRQSQQVFGMKQATGAMQAQAQIEAERARKQAEADKAAASRAREVGQVGTAGGALASVLAGDGLSTGFTDQLRTAAGGAGDAAGLDRLIAMVAKLAANSGKLSEAAKSKLDKLEAEIEDLRTAK